MSDVPRLGRVSFHEAATAAAPDKKDKADYKGKIAHEATRLGPLQKIQEAFDQMAPLADRHARGEPWDHAGSSFSTFTADVLSHAKLHRDVLRTAALAADALIEKMEDHVSTFTEEVEAAKPKEPEPEPIEFIHDDPAGKQQVTSATEPPPTPGFSLPIKSQEEHDAAVVEIERLMESGELSGEEEVRFQILDDAVKAWQDKSAAPSSGVTQ